MAKKKKANGQQQFLSPEKYLRTKARSLEIGKCYMTDTIFGQGEGHVIVTRNHTGGKVSMACYLVDTYCVGVKDSFYRLRMEPDEYQEFIDRYGEGFGLHECSYNEAHNLIYGAIAFAEEGGIEPDESFALTKYMLEEDTDGIPLIEYEYGKDGQHFLVAMNNLEASKYLPKLRKALGDDVKFMVRDDDY